MKKRFSIDELLRLIGELLFVTVFATTAVYLIVAIHSFFTSIFKGTL